MQRRVVITGRGVASPLGVGVERHREMLLSGQSVLRPSLRLASLGFPPCSVGEIPEETIKKSAASIPQRQKKLMSRAGVLAAIASFLAAEEAALGGSEVEPTRVGIFLATWFTFYDLRSFIRNMVDAESRQRPFTMDQERANRRCLETMNPVDSLKLLPNLTAGHLAIFHQAQGASRVIADGWTGGLLALSQAAQTIRDGELDMVLAGGSESPLEEGVFCDLLTLDVVARDGGGPETLCRPFDSRRSGMVLGEGAGVVVLEERGHALKRGATIFGEIVGSASTAPMPGEREGTLSLAIKNALKESRIEAQEVDLVHANGDATTGNDRAEWRAIRDVFGPHAAHLPITATKSLHGHLLSAAGPVELVSSLIMLEEGIVPPIANCERPDPECDLDLVIGQPRKKSGMRFALLNALGLFGEGASLVIRR